MKIEIGKKYVTADGETVGPMVTHNDRWLRSADDNKGRLWEVTSGRRWGDVGGGPNKDNRIIYEAVGTKCGACGQDLPKSEPKFRVGSFVYLPRHVKYVGVVTEIRSGGRYNVKWLCEDASVLSVDYHEDLLSPLIFGEEK